MADDNAALAGAEEGQDEQDFAIPGEGGSPEAAAGPPATPVQLNPQQAAPAPNATKISGKAQFFGNLLKTLVQGLQNAPGNPRNALDRGFMAASPRVQQQALSEDQINQANVAVAQAKALNAWYMVKRLPQDQQMKYVEAASKWHDQLIKEDGVEIETAGDEKGGRAEAARLNATDPRSKGGLGSFWSLPHYNEKGELEHSVVFVPTKDVLQNDIDIPNPSFDADLPESDTNQKTLTVPAGTPSKGVPSMISAMVRGAQAHTRSALADLTAANKMPEATTNDVLAKQSRMQAIIDKGGTLPAHNNLQADVTRLGKLHDKMEADEEAKKKAERPPKEEKPSDMAIGTLNGRQVAGTLDELKTAGAKGITKAGAAEAEKVNNARSLINVFDSNDPDDPGLVQLAAKLDKEGKLGPATIRFQQWLNQGNTAANFNAGDPDVQRLFTKLGLSTTGLMQVHVGARGSAQMLEHFEDLAKAKQMSPSAFRTALDTEARYVRMKAMRPEDTTKKSADTESDGDDPFAPFGGKSRKPK